MDSPTANSSLIPSAMDLLLVVPRLAQKAGSFAVFHMPEAVDNIASKIWSGGSMIADATTQETVANMTITNTSILFAQITGGSMLEASIREAWNKAGDQSSDSFMMSIGHGLAKLKNVGGIFSYLTSRWAITTFAVAIILNRTQFYASSREHLRLRWHVRAAIYMIPIAAFLYQMLTVLQTLKCQTSPFYPELRYGDPTKHLAIDFAAEGGFLHQLSSRLLFWQDDASCCQAQNMSSLGLGDDDKSEFRGSMSILYWFFATLCASQLFETLACALQGKQPMPETGMTIFEHSLAFAECEAMISSALGFGFFGITKSDGSSQGTGTLITRSEMLQRLNVPPEVLLVCLISCFSHISSAILAITGIRHRVRLINTGVWACCYMSAFFWSFSKILLTPADHVADHLGILRFPTVCVVGFIPHMLILVGIVVCGGIYSSALLATATSVPSDIAQDLSLRGRFTWAYNNLQANVQFSQNSAIRIKMSEDFYTTLLKIGFHVLTAASEAVYLNEGSRIHVANMTWVERKRINDMGEGIDQRRRPTIPHELLGEGIARGITFVDHQNGAFSQSPYARERKSKPIGQRQKQAGAELDTGLGMTQRRPRMQLTMDFVFGFKRLVVDLYARLFWFIAGHISRGLLTLLGKVGVARRPAWLVKAAENDEDQQRASIQIQPSDTELLGFYMLGPDGCLSLPPDDNVDVEVESRRRLQQAGTYQDEQQLDSELWKWFRRGGWFGEIDSSGDFEGPSNDDDDDTTSVISMSTGASIADDQEWEEEESGRRTPTQGDPSGNREPSPVENDLDLSSLSRLLNPHTSADREDARLLSYRLQSNRSMTRSQYRRTTQQDRAELLDGLRSSARPTPAPEWEEESDLEHFILETRRKAKASPSRAATWDTGAEGMGEGGPQCVVCQSTPRTVLVWPCGCLSMCDDCRVGLAARNYTKCICCRTDIVAYSRLYVP